MVHKFFAEKRLHNGLTYLDYINDFKKKVDITDISKLPIDKKQILEYTRLNYQRNSRIDKTYQVSNDLCEVVKSINKPELWMVITEDWCGDSAQNLPYIAKIAECNPLIDFRILARDQNPDIMDLYLTDGKSRSIPKLVAFDMEGNELFQWGPRPKEAQQIVINAIKNGTPKELYMEELHLWYGRNRGKNLEDEFRQIILGEK